MRKTKPILALLLLLFCYSTVQAASVPVSLTFDDIPAWNNVPPGMYLGSTPPGSTVPDPNWPGHSNDYAAQGIVMLGNPSFGPDGVVYSPGTSVAGYTMPAGTTSNFAVFGIGAGGGIVFMTANPADTIDMSVDVTMSVTKASTTSPGTLMCFAYGNDGSVYTLAGIPVGSTWATRTIDWQQTDIDGNQIIPDGAQINAFAVAMSSPGNKFAIDNVSFAINTSEPPPVPAPASLLLLGTGLVSLIRKRMKR